MTIRIELTLEEYSTHIGDFVISLRDAVWQYIKTFGLIKVEKVEIVIE